jgi:hypothetical protein
VLGGTVQRPGTPHKCRHEAIFTNESGVRQCTICSRVWEEPGEHIPGPWQPTSGYVSTSGLTSSGWSTRSIWNAASNLNLKPEDQHHHAVWSLDQVEAMRNYRNRPRGVATTYLEGNPFIPSSAAAREVASVKPMTRRWINNLVHRGIVSGFTSGKTMVHRNELMKYAKNHPANTANDPRTEVVRLGDCCSDAVGSVIDRMSV